MKAKRLQKIKDFEKFYDNCESLFTNLKDEDNRVEIFENEYMLIIAPGSRAGGNEKRVVEVFWGSRPYEFEGKGNKWKSLTETGATLFFYRNDTGDITISIYPAKTEFRKPIEDYISLYRQLDPKKLNDNKFIKSIWGDFIAYMECTSLDGNPTLLQRLRIAYLRNFNHLVVNNKWRPTKASDFTKEVLKWVLTGGIIFYLLPLLTESRYTEEEIQLKEINEKLENFSNRINRESIKTKYTSLKDSIVR